MKKGTKKGGNVTHNDKFINLYQQWYFSCTWLQNVSTLSMKPVEELLKL